MIYHPAKPARMSLPSAAVVCARPGGGGSSNNCCSVFIIIMGCSCCHDYSFPVGGGREFFIIFFSSFFPLFFAFGDLFIYHGGLCAGRHVKKLQGTHVTLCVLQVVKGGFDWFDGAA